MLLLAGVLLPISLGPVWIQVLAHLNPLYYLVAAARSLAVGRFGQPEVWQAFAVLVPLCVLVLAWATGSSAGPSPDRRRNTRIRPRCRRTSLGGGGGI